MKQLKVFEMQQECAAIGLLEPEDLEDNLVRLHIFALEKEKMELL